MTNISDAKFTIGCDPEIFVTRRGKPFSVYGVLKGTKEEPYKTDGGAYQVDGMAAEFNTDPVAIRDRYNYVIENSFHSWDKLIIKQIQQIREVLPSGCALRMTPTLEFGKEFLDNQPDAAKELGCDPDYNAYTLKENPRPDGERTFRTGAGHIHIGWGSDIPPLNEDHMKICGDFVKTLDATVGLFMTVIDRDPLRRELYGKAGAFRPKSYGVEYRTPSNVWIQNRDMRYYVWFLVQRAIDYQTKQQSIEQICGRDDVERIINEGDHEAALIALDYLFERHIRISTWRWTEYSRPARFTRILNSINKKNVEEVQ